MSLIATIVCIAFIGWLFALDRDREVPASVALWIPTIWLLINGSRSVSEWLHPSSEIPLSLQYSQGNPLDAAIFGALILAGILVLNFRFRRAAEVLRQNLPMVLFFCYCGLSIFWSDYQFIALKRYFKALGDLVMVLVMLTDPQPLYAIKRVFARMTFILIPVSVLLILFYPARGTAFDPVDRVTMYVGVTTFKNLLGMTCLVCGLSSLWSFMGAWEDRQMARRSKHLLAHGLMALTALALILRCNSMTSFSCYLLAAGAMVMSTRPWTLRKPRRIHWVVATTLLIPLFSVFIDSGLVHILGRKPNLTDRTVIWRAVLSMHTNPFVGTGFESFWLGSHLQSVWDLSVHGIQEAHNGYIEIYINLGWIGEFFLFAMIVAAYPRILVALRRVPRLGQLGVGFFTAGLIYSLAEAGFRMMNPIWIAFLLGIASPALAWQRKPSGQKASVPVLRAASGAKIRVLQ